MPNISRRGFLAIFAAAAAGQVVGDYDPSRLEWFAPASMPKLAALPEAVPLKTLVDARAVIEHGAIPRTVRPLFSLQQQTEALARELWTRLGSPPDLIRVPHVGLMGDTGRIPRVELFDPNADYSVYGSIACRVDPIVMDERFTVRSAMSPSETWRMREHLRTDEQLRDYLHHAHVKPMAAALAQYIERHQINAFGDALPLPLGVDEACRYTDLRSGITVRGVRFFDWLSPEPHHETWFDILGGRA